MNDISRLSFAPPGHRAVRRQSVARPRRRPRPYPQGHRPQYRPRRGDRPGRPVRLRQIDAADGDGRAGAAGHRLVVVAGQDLAPLDEDALARFRGRNVGIVFQSFHLIPTMTALENVAVPLELAGAADALRARRDANSPRSGSRERLHHYPAATVRRRAAARRARPRAGARSRAILVADEPTGNLDEATGREIIDLLFAGHASAAPRSFWSPTTPRSPRAATASCGCAPAGSTRPCRTRRNDRAGRYARRVGAQASAKGRRLAWRLACASCAAACAALASSSPASRSA